MRYLIAAIALVMGLETAALACSCIPAPETEEEARRIVGEVARNVAAVVEVDVIRGYDHKRHLGESVQVRRVLAGRAPRAFRVHRSHPPDSATCDMSWVAGGRAFVMIFPVRNVRAGEPVYAIHNLCANHWVQDRQLRTLLVAEVRRNAR